MLISLQVVEALNGDLFSMASFPAALYHMSVYESNGFWP